MHAERDNRLEQFLALLVDWNRSIRLTGSTDRAALERHIKEAETLLPYLPTTGRVLDVGSGGGFPAIPLAVARPDQEFHLVEPIAKKVAFLRACRRALELENVTVVRGRDEDLEPTPPFDNATSQATFAPSEWFRRARRLVRPGGTILALLGPSASDLPAAAELHAVSIGGDRDRRVAVLRR